MVSGVLQEGLERVARWSWDGGPISVWQPKTHRRWCRSFTTCIFLANVKPIEKLLTISNQHSVDAENRSSELQRLKNQVQEHEARLKSEQAEKAQLTALLQTEKKHLEEIEFSIKGQEAEASQCKAMIELLTKKVCEGTQNRVWFSSVNSYLHQRKKPQMTWEPLSILLLNNTKASKWKCEQWNSLQRKTCKSFHRVTSLCPFTLQHDAAEEELSIKDKQLSKLQRSYEEIEAEKGKGDKFHW